MGQQLAITHVEERHVFVHKWCNGMSVSLSYVHAEIILARKKARVHMGVKRIFPRATIVDFSRGG